MDSTHAYKTPQSTLTPFQAFEMRRQEMTKQTGNAVIHHADVTWRAVNYGFLGSTLRLRGSVPTGMVGGVALTEGLHRLGGKKDNDRRLGRMLSATALYSAVTTAKNFWMLNWVERHPYSPLAKFQIFENVLFNPDLRKKLFQDLGQDLRLAMGQRNRPLFGRLAEGFRRVGQQLNHHVSDPTIHRQTLGMKGAHRTSRNFILWLLKDAARLPIEKVKTLDNALTYVFEAFRGLPITYQQAKRLPNVSQMAIGARFKQLWPFVLADFAAYGALLSGFRLAGRLKNLKRSEPTEAPVKWVMAPPNLKL
jgi:hypothetical protein